MPQLKFSSPEEALAVAKEAIWLAWQAVGAPGGMGWLQNNPSASKEDVWAQAYHQRDYSMRNGPPERVHADYVFGRMMKLSFTLRDDTLGISDSECRSDYQAWCHKYPTYAALFDAATESVRAKPEAQAA